MRRFEPPKLFFVFPREPFRGVIESEWLENDNSVSQYAVTHSLNVLFQIAGIPCAGVSARCNWHLYGVLRILDDEKTSRDWSFTPAGVINDAPVGVERSGITSVQIESGHDVKGLQQSD